MMRIGAQMLTGIIHIRKPRREKGWRKEEREGGREYTGNLTTKLHSVTCGANIICSNWRWQCCGRWDKMVHRDAEHLIHTASWVTRVNHNTAIHPCMSPCHCGYMQKPLILNSMVLHLSLWCSHIDTGFTTSFSWAYEWQSFSLEPPEDLSTQASFYSAGYLSSLSIFNCYYWMIWKHLEHRLMYRRHWVDWEKGGRKDG